MEKNPRSKHPWNLQTTGWSKLNIENIQLFTRAPRKMSNKTDTNDELKANKKS
jgi:hypothetical protein